MKEKKKRTRRVFKDFGYLECDAFAEYLHGMSMKGWHFREWRLGLVFEKGEPEDVCYCVEVFPKGSEMDTKPEEPAEEYAEYCQAAGWAAGCSLPCLLPYHSGSGRSEGSLGTGYFRT
ncbi:DUF2812 domain-containing protein [Mediterraneibacter glycyrrhizinilyticus]|nr:DUF2812 domain-containing protein [Mediterraneibacter glycyrrhizinilyticus]